MMNSKEKAKVYTLAICHTCHRVIKKDEHYVPWENSLYCEPCFDEYLELIEPEDWMEDSK